MTGFDAFYQLLLEDGFLPGETAPFPNKVLTRELYRDMQDRVPELRFVAQNQVGTYFGQAHFKQLGRKPWRTCEGNGWEFPPLVDLRREWEQRQGAWEWPNDLSGHPIRAGRTNSGYRHFDMRFW